MDTVLCLLVLFTATIAFDSGAWDPQCISDPDCTTWSDIGNLSNVPHEAKKCCTILKIRTYGCPLGNVEYDLDTKLCASFCPVRITYEWGPEVFYLNRQACSNKQMPCTLPANSRTIFKTSPIPGFVGSMRAVRTNFFGGFNDRAMVASSPDILQVANIRDDATHGGYWTFIPLYKVTCGTYTEAWGLAENSEECLLYNNNLTNSWANVCIREPVSDPNDNHLAIGITELVPVTITKQGTWQGSAAEHWTNEYSKAALPYDVDHGKNHDSVRWGLGEFQKHSHLIDQSGNPTRTATAYKIDENSPLTKDCLQAASEFYMPLWNNARVPYVEGWKDGCLNQTPTSMMNDGSDYDMKPCVIIGSYETCQIQLMFNLVRFAAGAKEFYTSDYANRDGGGIWSLLNSFQMIFDEASDNELGRTAGIVEVIDDSGYKAWVMFVPSNGAKVTLRS